MSIVILDLLQPPDLAASLGGLKHFMHVMWHTIPVAIKQTSPIARCTCQLSTPYELKLLFCTVFGATTDILATRIPWNSHQSSAKLQMSRNECAPLLKEMRGFRLGRVKQPGDQAFESTSICMSVLIGYGVYISPDRVGNVLMKLESHST